MLLRNCSTGAMVLLWLILSFVPLRGQDCDGIFEEVGSSTILNHSFENIYNCPSSYSQMDLAVGWIQASIPTSDLIHYCGNNPDLDDFPTIPLPLPDGNGLVGMLNLYDNNWLEYVGTCPTEVMEAFTPYTLRFYVGFGNGGGYPSPSSVPISLFGNPSCGAIPFDGYGCPISTNPSWIELDQITVSGNNEWREVVLHFTPTVDIASIVLGPSCQYSPDQGFIFMDELILTKTDDVSVDAVININGTPCEDQIVLNASPASGYLYEWYKDGDLISGVTGSSYTLAAGEEGFYHVKLIDPNGNGCVESPLVNISLPALESQIDSVLCHGETLEVAGVVLDSSGTYTYEVISSLGCDSTIYVELEILEPFLTNIDTTLCAGEVLELSGEIMETSGNYVLDLYTEEMGCDSTVFIDLTIQPPIEVVYQASEVLCYGDYSEVQVETLSGDALAITWEDGTLSFSHSLLAGDYTFTLTDAVGCTGIESISISEPPLLEGNVSYQDISCIGFDDGIVDVWPVGGVGPYDIYFDDYPFIKGDSALYPQLAPGFYAVTVIDQNACVYEEEIELVEPEDPEVTISAETTEMTLGNTQRLTLESNNNIFFDSFNWSPSAEMSCPDCPVTYYTPDQIGAEYISLELMDVNGCLYQDSLRLFVDNGVAIPNAFSPNGDGLNDMFYVMGQGVSVISRLSIFSRNGAEVFRSVEATPNDEGQGWDGTFLGKKLSSDVFVYLVELVLLDGTALTFSGDLTLVR